MPQRKRSRFYKIIQAQANRLLQKYIRSGRMPKASGQCSDCGSSKYLCYDHRDYSEALKVDVVCYSCNGLRGSAAIPFVDVETLNVAVLYREAA